MEVQQPNQLKNYSNKRRKTPISFSPLILTLNNLNPVILSPAIFSPLILAPSILGPIILSPWLFVPLIIKPRLLTPLILSPAVFSPVCIFKEAFRRDSIIKDVFKYIENKWNDIIYLFGACCDNNCVNNDNPTSFCTEGNGYIQIKSNTEIEYINCMENGENKGAGILADNYFNKPINELIQTYTLYYYEVKLIFEKNEIICFIHLLN
ncbi:hypothetical protein Mgra_00006820 [Meloidogyne graminicola]|uniref:Uncharacterized protein n=1 Tax=Meloidogyne graminicola TaxID=189291 RepID=A0A8S9ZK55_9BILA|nr:hypothetical protein Mgra_00006820 [Meloidogyne graminicola]